jgi:hypothetical protein
MLRCRAGTGAAFSGCSATDAMCRRGSSTPAGHLSRSRSNIAATTRRRAARRPAEGCGETERESGGLGYHISDISDISDISAKMASGGKLARMLNCCVAARRWIGRRPRSQSDRLAGERRRE